MWCKLLQWLFVWFMFLIYYTNKNGVLKDVKGNVIPVIPLPRGTFWWPRTMTFPMLNPNWLIAYLFVGAQKKVYSIPQKKMSFTGSRPTNFPHVIPCHTISPHCLLVARGRCCSLRRSATRPSRGLPGHIQIGKVLWIPDGNLVISCNIGVSMVSKGWYKDLINIDVKGLKRNNTCFFVAACVVSVRTKLRFVDGQDPTCPHNT